MALKGTFAGCGFFAQFQMEAWNRLVPAAKIAAVCDLDEAKARAFAAKYGVERVYTNLAAMLDAERPDFLDIVTRPEQHLPMASEAARRGVHVLCQKPFAPTLSEARQIIEACRPVRLMVNENFRFQAWYREIKKLLTGGTIGEPFSFRWIYRETDGLLDPPYPNQPYFENYPRLLIYETLVHWLDGSRYLFGEPTGVKCEISRINQRMIGEDLAMILLRFPGALRGVIEGNRCSPLDEESELLGSLRIDGLGGSLWVGGNCEITIELRGGARYEHQWPNSAVGPHGDACYNTQKHFIDCLAAGAEFETHGEDYLKTMRLVDLCYESASQSY